MWVGPLGRAPQRIYWLCRQGLPASSWGAAQKVLIFVVVYYVSVHA